MLIPQSYSDYNPPYRQEMFFEPALGVRQSPKLGSLTVGDYQDRLVSSSTSYTIDPNYKLLPCNSSNYRELQELIMSWINEPDDNDIQEWPEIEKELNDHRLKFSDDM